MSDTFFVVDSANAIQHPAVGTLAQCGRGKITPGTMSGGEPGHQHLALPVSLLDELKTLAHAEDIPLSIAPPKVLG